jgi:hypothetical protein
MCKKLYIHSLADYIREVESLNLANSIGTELLFRGQPEDLPLIPKLGRPELELTNNGIKETEGRMFEEFEKGILPLTEFLTTSKWDTLALAQHHGMATRLLDWSKSALTAIWFTVALPPKKDGSGKYKDGVVWVLTPEKGDFISRSKEDGAPFDISITKIFIPKAVTRRISAQSAVFTVHYIDENKKMVNLEQHNKFKNQLTKLLIKGKDFAQIRETLVLSGISHFTLFPDLDGFCKLINWKYTKFEDEVNMKNSPYYGAAIGGNLL